MKQTKNALSMLLNAYRAVYKSAYFKGLASAVVLTAGLAAGAANAAATDDFLDKTAWGSELGTSVNGVITISGTQEDPSSTDDGQYTNIQITESASSDEAFNIIIASGSVTDNYISGGSAATVVSGLNGTITIDKGSNTAAGLTIAGKAADNDYGASLTVKAFNVKNGTLNITAGAGQTNGSAAALNADTITVGSAVGTAPAETVSGAITISGAAAAKASGAATLGQFSQDNVGLPSIDANNGKHNSQITVYADGKINLASAKADASHAVIQGESLNLRGGTIDVADQSGGTIASHIVTMDGGKISVGSGAELDIDLVHYDDDSIVSQTANQWDEGEEVGTMTVTSGTIDVQGLFKVAAGTVDLTGATLTVNNDATVDATNGRILLAQGANKQATVQLTKSSLEAFTTAATGDNADKAGYVEMSGGTLEFKDAAVNLDDFTLADSYSLGTDIVVDDIANTIKGNTLQVTKAIGATSNAAKLTAEADQIILGKTTDSYASTSLKDINVSTFVAHDSFEVQYQQESANTSNPQVDSSIILDGNTSVGTDGVVTAENGVVTGKDFILGGTKANTLQVSNGNWTVEPQLTIASGSITVGNVTTAGYETVSGADASLTFEQELLIDLSSNEDVTIKADGSKIDTTDATNLKGSAVIDLTAGIGIAKPESATADGSVTLAATKYGEIILNEDDAQAILTTAGGNSTDTLGNLQLEASQSGAITVQGDLNVEFSDFTDDATSVSGAINIADSGILNVDKIALNAQKDTTNQSDNTGSSQEALNFSGGTINAQDVVIGDNSTYTSGDAKPTVSNVYFQKGTINIANSLTVNNDVLVLGKSSDSAVINLKYAGDTEGKVAAKEINLATGTTSALTFEGDWDASGTVLDIDVGTVTVKSGEADQGIINTVKLSGIELAGGKFIAQNDSEVTMDTLNFTGSVASALEVSGSVTINGIEGDVNTADQITDHGITFGGADGSIAINGGSLTFGEYATERIITGYTDTAGSLVTTADGFNKIAMDTTQGGELVLSLSAKEFSAAELAELKSDLFTAASLDTSNGSVHLQKGFINIGAASIEDVDVVGGRIEARAVSENRDVISDVTTAELQNANVYNADDTTWVVGSIGSISVAEGETSFNKFWGDTELTNAADNGSWFVSNAAQNAGVDFAVPEGVEVSLVNGGKAANITLEGTNSELTVDGTGATVTEIQSVDGGQGDFNVYADTVVAEDVDVAYVDVADALTVGGTLATDDLDVSSSLTAKTITLNAEGSDLDVDGGSITAESININYDATTDLLRVYNGGSITAQDVQFADNSQAVLRVGQSSVAAEDSYDQDNTDANGNVLPLESSTGYFEVTGSLALNGASIYVDPDYGDATSLVAINAFDGVVSAESNELGDVGEVDGNLYIGKNAALGIGTSLADLKQAIAKYQTAGSLSIDEGRYGSLLYLNGYVHIADGKKILIDSAADVTDYDDIVANSQYEDAAGALQGSDLYLSNHSAILLTDKAFGENMAGTAITFDKTSNATVYSEGGEIVLIGSFNPAQTLNIFNDKETGAAQDGVKVVVAGDADYIKVTSENGLFEGKIMEGEQSGMDVGLTVSKDSRSILGGASDPVYDYLMKYATKTVNYAAVAADPNVEAIKVLGTDRISDEAKTALEQSDPEAAALYTEQIEGGWAKPANNEFLNTVVTTGHGEDAETVARMAVYGGAAEVALAASSTTYEAINSRLGMGNPNGNLIMADNANGAGIWLAPVYKNHESDDFDAQGVDYGVDLDLTGVALGADYTFAQGFRAGVMFNIGSGDADGQGAGSAVSNDFDYWSAGIYGDYAYGNFSLAADVTYTAVDNDIDANTAAAGKVSASMDADVISAGITGQYKFEFSALDVTPHLGVRYSYIDIDDYSIADIASSNVDELSVFSIPVGVTLSKDFATASGWNIKPALDLVVTANTGDDEVDSDITFNGVDYTTDLSTEFMDSVTYGATLGLQVQKDAFQFGLGVNYTGSENTDEYGVTANARFTF